MDKEAIDEIINLKEIEFTGVKHENIQAALFVGFEMCRLRLLLKKQKENAYSLESGLASILSKKNKKIYLGNGVTLIKP